jgi:hypothetical protein
MNDQELKELIEDLDTIGHARKLSMSISIGVNTNEFLLTNVSEFLSCRKNEFEEKGVVMNWVSYVYTPSSSVSEKDNNPHTLVLIGLSWKVQEIYEEVLKWAWVDPDKTFIKSKETFE